MRGTSSYRENLETILRQKIAEAYRSSKYEYSEGYDILQATALTAIASGIAGAVTLPIIYATGVGSVVGLGMVGMVAGVGTAVVCTPFAMQKVIPPIKGTIKAVGVVLNLTHYMQAWKETKKAKMQKTEPKKATQKPKLWDRLTSFGRDQKTGFNTTSNPKQQVEKKNTPTSTPKPPTP